MNNPFAINPNDINPKQSSVSSYSSFISELKNGSKELRDELAYERKLRFEAEKKIEELTSRLAKYEKREQAKTARQNKIPGEYCEFLPDGRRKARAAQPIRSYEDFKAIQDYFLNKGDIRDWTLWTIGVSLGLRISDLLSLKIEQFLNPDRSFRERLFVVEQKTKKLNGCLITESVKDAIKKYLDSTDWKFSPTDYLFKSQKTGGKMYEEYGWKILSDAGKALNLPVVIGSHTMRKSFANIAACIDKSCVDMNSITKIQGLLNHSDQKVTMRYLNTYQKMYDGARKSVSDFVLGKTDVHELVAGTNVSLSDIAEKLDALENALLKTNV